MGTRLSQGTALPEAAKAPETSMGIIKKTVPNELWKRGATKYGIPPGPQEKESSKGLDIWESLLDEQTSTTPLTLAKTGRSWEICSLETRN